MSCLRVVEKWLELKELCKVFVSEKKEKIEKMKMQ